MSNNESISTKFATISVSLNSMCFPEGEYFVGLIGRMNSFSKTFSGNTKTILYPSHSRIGNYFLNFSSNDIVKNNFHHEFHNLCEYRRKVFFSLNVVTEVEDTHFAQYNELNSKHFCNYNMFRHLWNKGNKLIKMPFL